MNMFTLHAHKGIRLLCCKHPVVSTGRGKNGSNYITEPASPPRPNRLDNNLSSDRHQKAKAWKNSRISLFNVIHQDRISDKVNTVAERGHLIYCVFKLEIAKPCKPWWTALAIMIVFATSAMLFL